jgi:NADH-quinone oxidoreductase subunit M
MNLVVLGVFSFNNRLEGAVLQSISHGFVSGAMFLLVGMLYENIILELYIIHSTLHTNNAYLFDTIIFLQLQILLAPGTSSQW